MRRTLSLKAFSKRSKAETKTPFYQRTRKWEREGRKKGEARKRAIEIGGQGGREGDIVKKMGERELLIELEK